MKLRLARVMVLAGILMAWTACDVCAQSRGGGGGGRGGGGSGGGGRGGMGGGSSGGSRGGMGGMPSGGGRGGMSGTPTGSGRGGMSGMPSGGSRGGSWHGGAGGGSGSGHSHNGQWHNGSYNHNHGGYYHGGGYGYYGGYRGYPYYGYGFGYPWGIGISIGRSYSPYYGYGYGSGYGYGYGDGAYVSSYSTPVYGQTVSLDSVPTAESYRANTASAYPLAPDKVRLLVLVPTPDVELRINDQLMDQPGTDRLFDSPAMEPGKTYIYKLQATWSRDGRQITRKKQIDVVPGQAYTVEFKFEAEVAPPPEPRPGNPG